MIFLRVKNEGIVEADMLVVDAGAAVCGGGVIVMDELANPLAHPVSIGSNQLSKRSTVASAVGCEESGFVVMLVMA